MFSKILSNLNWIDIVLVVIVLRVIYIGLKQGFVIEFFKLLGTFVASFIILHYYSAFGQVIHVYAFIPQAVQHAIAFLLLWFLVVLIFKFIRDGWMLLFKGEAHPAIHKWGGFSFAVLRAALICGLTFLLIFMSGNSYLIKTAKQSYLSPYLADISPKIYGICFDNFVGKLFPNERKNVMVFPAKTKKNEKNTSD